MNLDISVIVVSYNTADLIGACLASVLSSRDVSLEIAVVDNASTDGSAALVRDRFSSVRLIANTVNRGFGAANNQALADCQGRYVVFLNPDTTVPPEAFAQMVTFMEAHPEVGLAGPVVRNPDGSPQSSSSERYPGHRHGAGDLGKLPGRLAAVLGACQIARADLLRELGGFDEDFFLYGEDQDLCLRVRRRGLAIGQITDTVILHHGGQSERGSPPEAVVRRKARAELLFFQKHYRPETVRAIRRYQAARALWRIGWLRLSLPFTRNQTRAREKLLKYQVVRDEMRHRHGNHGTTSGH
jgi:GT2 family glycosyltransferase